MKIRKSVFVVAVCAVVLSGTFIYVKVVGKSGSDFKRMNGGQSERTAVTVRTQTAHLNALQDYVLTNGEIESRNSVEVYPDIGGKIAKVYVSLGSHVKKGDVIAEVDPSVPGSQFTNSPVYAPISGTISSTPLEVGAKVSTSTALTVIGDVKNLQITSKIPERYVAALKKGLHADVTVGAYSDTVFSASVVNISPVVDPKSRTKEIIMVFDEKDERINAGMFAKVKLNTILYEGYITVPESAVIELDGTNILYVASSDGTTVSKREVTLGHSVDNTVQVLSGIEEGERVVVEGIRLLYDGALIKDIQKTEAE